jgi:hypothetical protein
MDFDAVNLADLEAWLLSNFDHKPNHCTIDIGDYLNPLLPGGQNGRITLDFLDVLRQRDSVNPLANDFLPESIWVRDCMRFVFSLLVGDAPSPEIRTFYLDHLVLASQRFSFLLLCSFPEKRERFTIVRPLEQRRKYHTLSFFLIRAAKLMLCSQGNFP